MADSHSKDKKDHDEIYEIFLYLGLKSTWNKAAGNESKSSFCQRSEQHLIE